MGETTSVESTADSILIDDNDNIFVISFIDTNYQLSQLNWPIFTSKFMFSSHFSLFYGSLFIPTPKLYTFTAYVYTTKYMKCLLTMTNDGGFNISDIFMIKNSILDMYYYDDVIYIISSDHGMLELCSLSLHNYTINCIIRYNITQRSDSVMEYYAGTLFGDILYFVAESGGNKYWVETNMITFMYITNKLPLLVGDIRCMKGL